MLRGVRHPILDLEESAEPPPKEPQVSLVRRYLVPRDEEEVVKYERSSAASYAVLAKPCMEA